MKSLAIIILLFSAFTISANDDYTLYLVRHAEKQKIKPDPELTACGIVRANELASILAKAQIKAVYSTNYKRTMATAAPFSQQQALSIEQYDPRDLAKFSKYILSKKENALIVGHSNTTPQLTALISDEKVKDITEKEYRGLYQVNIQGNKKTFTLLMQPHTCQ